MASRVLRGEEFAGLAIALAAHAGLVALLVLHPAPVPVVPAPQRVTVTLAGDVGITSTSPQPQAEATPPAAPKIATLPESDPIPLAAAQSVPLPAPKPLSPPVSVPRVRPQPIAIRPPEAHPLVRPPLHPAPAPSARPASASRISSDFLKGVTGTEAKGAAHNPPATAIGPAVRSALLGAVSRALKPRWVAPQGAEADRLVTYVTWSLNRDGSLGGAPRAVRQEGITDANRAQAARHAEQAVRAVQLAAPFSLPSEYYDAWKRIIEFRFDRKLSQ
jgi:hypothetical protein